MCETTKQANTGIRWRFMDQLEDLDFADDIALISTTQHQMQKKTDKLAETSQRIGLNISKTKTQVMTARTQSQLSSKMATLSKKPRISPI